MSEESQTTAVQTAAAGDANTGGDANNEGQRAGESKADAFRRLYKQRIKKFDEFAASFVKIFVPKYYEFTEDQVKAIFTAIRAKIDTMEKTALDNLAPKSAPESTSSAVEI